MHLNPRLVATVAVAVAIAVAVAALFRSEPAAAPNTSGAPERRLLTDPSQQPPTMAAEPDERPLEPLPTTVRRDVAADERARGEQVPIGDQERVRRRAAAVAEQLGLTAEEQAALTAVLLEEQARRATAFRALRRAQEDPTANARVRADLDPILAWKTHVLQTRFGTERAAAMMRR